jgi:hypothetical protein
MLSVPPLLPDWLETQAVSTEKDTPLGSVGALDGAKPPARVSSARKWPPSPVVPPGWVEIPTSMLVISGGTLVLVAAGCSPLPGRSLDPMSPKPASITSAETPQSSVRAGASSSAKESGRPDLTASTTTWAGRYQDSRGAGELTFSLLRGSTTVSGTWRLRTGGGGPVIGVLEPSGRGLQLRMDNTAPECPGTFEGSAEINDTKLVGTYQGKDCEGPVSNGRLELHLVGAVK